MTATAPPFATSAFAPGTLLADYRVERILARGQHGTLYAAVDQRSGQPLALKTVPLASEYEGRDLLDARERFLREARTAASLSHPDIVAVFGGGEVVGQGFIVMELLSGCDLSRYTRPARLLPEPVVLHIAARLADALAYAHAQGVVHRDVKPENVMVDLSRRQVKLTDFGLARVTDSARSRSGVMVGTPAYMAPEQLAGAPVDGRADLYALGVLLFQLLSGQLPYAASSMGQLLQQIAHAAPRPLQSLRPDLPVELCQLVGHLLQKQRDLRPGDGRQIAQALRQIEQAWPATPLVPGPWPQGAPPGRTLDPGHNPSRS